MAGVRDKSGGSGRVAEQKSKLTPKDASSMMGVGVDLTWLQLIGVCPYVMVSPEGECRIGWIPTTWCVVRLLLLTVFQVLRHLGGFPTPSGARPTVSIADKLGFILLNTGTQLSFMGGSVMLLVFGPRLTRLLRKMAALRKMMGILTPFAYWGHGPLTFSFMWMSVGFYVWSIFRLSGYFIHTWVDDGQWLEQMLQLVDWVLSYPVFPGVMLLSSTVLVQLKAATRSTLPPGWEQLLADVMKEATQCFPCHVTTSTTVCSLPTYPAASLPSFLRRAQTMLLQTEEVLACLLEYVGGALLVLMTCGLAFFTSSTYFFLVTLQNDRSFDYYFLGLTAVIVLAMLEVNLAVESLVHERQRCARVYRRLMLHPDVTPLLVAGEVVAALDRPLQVRITHLFNLGGTCFTTVCSLVLSYLVIALQFSDAGDTM